MAILQNSFFQSSLHNQGFPEREQRPRFTDFTQGQKQLIDKVDAGTRCITRLSQVAGLIAQGLAGRANLPYHRLAVHSVIYRKDEKQNNGVATSAEVLKLVGHFGQ